MPRDVDDDSAYEEFTSDAADETYDPTSPVDAIKLIARRLYKRHGAVDWDLLCDEAERLLPAEAWEHAHRVGRKMRCKQIVRSMKLGQPDRQIKTKYYAVQQTLFPDLPDSVKVPIDIEAFLTRDDDDPRAVVDTNGKALIDIPMREYEALIKLRRMSVHNDQEKLHELERAYITVKPTWQRNPALPFGRICEIYSKEIGAGTSTA
jgi:hypothetical protein